ncbi:dynein regulatory complex protein 8 isoform X3 [Gallus gallus]|nr:dynein regulatory complex protein 8 isoform X3 [Gallus gallus]XP_040554451.1 dynein regulatory complex protein 8 isoform X3 [Gallus gallus]
MCSTAQQQVQHWCVINVVFLLKPKHGIKLTLAQVEEEEPTGYVHLEKFLPVMTKVLLDRSYRPIPEDVLLHAFEALDENKSGYITKEELVKHMTEEGEPFTEEEMEEMLSSALDPETNAVHYRNYISLMVVDETDDLPQ